MAFAIICMVIAVGSVASSKEAATDPVVPSAIRIANSSLSYSKPPNFQWFAITQPTDSAPLLLYTVPGGYGKLQIDDLIVTNMGNTACQPTLIRGSTTSNYAMISYLAPKQNLQHSYNRFILEPGEQIRLWCYQTTTYWQITGHWVYS